MKIRESNYELLRIISMFFIIVWHVITHSGLEVNSTGATNFFINMLLFLTLLPHKNALDNNRKMPFRNLHPPYNPESLVIHPVHQCL